MNSHIKYSLLLTVAGCFVAMSASAKVTPIGKYMGIDPDKCTGSDCKADITCSKKGYYNSPNDTIGANCKEVRIIGNKLCYSCSCDTDKYPFTSGNCSQTGFTAPQLTASNGCHLPATEKKDDKKYYTHCLCNENAGYHNPDKFTKEALDGQFPFVEVRSPDFKVAAAHNNDKKVSCKYTGAYDCANGSSKNAPNTDPTSFGGQYIKYTSISLLQSNGTGNFKCTSGVTINSPLYMDNNPTACIEMKQANISYHDKRPYYYNTGNCVNEINCSANKPTTSCVEYATKTGKSYSNADITCYQYTGCNFGKGDSYTCHGSYPPTDTTPFNIAGDTITYTAQTLNYIFARSKETAGSMNCLKITGCNTGVNFIERGELGKTAYSNRVGQKNPVRNYTTHTEDNHYIYGGIPSTGNVVYHTTCAMPERCLTEDGYYDVTAGTATEWLKYFVE